MINAIKFKFNALANEVKYWMGKRDFFNSHKMLVKSGEVVTMFANDNHGKSASVFSTEPDMVEIINGIINSFESKPHHDTERTEING